MVGQAGRAGEGPAQACRGGQRRLEHMGAWLEQAAAAHEKQASGSCGTGCPPGDGQEGGNGGHLSRASLIAQLVKNLRAVQETWVRFLGWEDPLEKEMATHPNILAWEIP